MKSSSRLLQTSAERLSLARIPQNAFDHETDAAQPGLPLLLPTTHHLPQPTMSSMASNTKRAVGGPALGASSADAGSPTTSSTLISETFQAGDPTGALPGKSFVSIIPSLRVAEECEADAIVESRDFGRVRGPYDFSSGCPHTSADEERSSRSTPRPDSSGSGSRSKGWRSDSRREASHV